MHLRRIVRRLPLLFATTAALSVSALSQKPPATASEWITSADRSSNLTTRPQTLAFTASQGAPLTIIVNPARQFQRMDGFGFALTGGSTELLMAMSPASRAALLQHLFGPGPDSIHVSYLRVSVGSSDMNRRVYTYDDMPAGETDPSLAHFGLGPDMTDVIPVLQQILALDPGVSILATPWSAPSWMKSNGLPKAGSLLPANFQVYARYLVSYLQAMAAQGIPIRALTMQNEPLNANNTPSMGMSAAEQATFLADALGPALRRAHLPTEVIVYDHNLDRPDYPLDVLANPRAAQFATGTGFHLYGGSVDAMTTVHNAHPDKAIFFTEQMVTQEDTAAPLRIADALSRIVIGATRNWSKVVLLWNLAADPQDGPHTPDGGCPVCQGAVTIAGDRWTPNLAYSTIAQIAKFVPPGSLRIASDTSSPGILPNVAFRTPDHRIVLLVANPAAVEQPFDVQQGASAFHANLRAGDVATFVWSSATP